MAVHLFMINRTASFILALVMISNIIGASAGKSEFSDLRLKQLNKPALKSIESPDGDIIDCISITEQPAFDDPLLRNHTIQMRPSSSIEGLFEGDAVSLDNGTGSGVIAQLWRTNGECPESTIPIRRTTRENYGKKYPNNISQPKFYNHSDDVRKGHEYAAVTVADGRYNGGKARINIWKPRVQDPDEFSLSQIWVSNGRFGSDLNTLEAGWQVDIGSYSDDNPRLFIYWTRDSYRNTGCYNHMCPGFVQISSAFALGASMKPISTYGGSQYEITLLITKDPETGNWWLGYGKTMIGYWPSSIVPNLADVATEIAWGGEIINVRANGQHTTTEMGSGHFADEKYGKASYFRNLGVVDESNTLRDPRGLEATVTKPSCYNLKILSSKTWGTYFYYGGPGRNPRCP